MKRVKAGCGHYVSVPAPPKFGNDTQPYEYPAPRLCKKCERAERDRARGVASSVPPSEE